MAQTVCFIVFISKIMQFCIPGYFNLFINNINLTLELYEYSFPYIISFGKCKIVFKIGFH